MTYYYIMNYNNIHFIMFNPRRSHPAQYGETFDWSANLIA